MKTGKLPPREDARTLRLANYRIAKPKAPPRIWGFGTLFGDWGMLGNDEWGDCIAEGSLVPSSGVYAAARIPYRGPLLTLVFASGKKVSVTPNHAVLTPRGFTRARFLKKGDYAIRARGPEIMECLVRGHDLDHSEAPVEQIFATLERRAARAGIRKTMVEAVDLHGDERFIDGDVDVVTTHGLLKHESLTAFSKPNGKEKIGSRGEHERVLHRDRTSREPSLAGRTAAHCCVSLPSHTAALLDREVRVSQRELGALRADRDTRLLEQSPEVRPAYAGLVGEGAITLTRDVTINVGSQVADLTVAPETESFALSPSLMASRLQPSADGHLTDTQLGTNLLGRFPSLVSLDRLVDVDVRMFEGHVYDLSTRMRWFVANGIVAHNCVFAGAGHETMLWSSVRGGPGVHITAHDALSDYSAVTGFTQDDPSSDQGTVVLDALRYRQKTGIVDSHGKRHKIAAYAALEPGDWDTMVGAAYEFGAVGIGFQFPDTAMEQFSDGDYWDIETGSSIEGGHYVPIVGSRNSAARVTCVTWGRRQQMTKRFYEQLCDEAWVLLSEEMIRVDGSGLHGYDWERFQRDLAALA